LTSDTVHVSVHHDLHSCGARYRAGCNRVALCSCRGRKRPRLDHGTSIGPDQATARPHCIGTLDLKSNPFSAPNGSLQYLNIALPADGTRPAKCVGSTEHGNMLKDRTTGIRTTLEAIRSGADDEYSGSGMLRMSALTGGWELGLSPSAVGWHRLLTRILPGLLRRSHEGDWDRRYDPDSSGRSRMSGGV